MFKPNDRVVYPFDGYGVGEIQSVIRNELDGKLNYYIHFDSGNKCNLQETHRLVAFDPENKEHVEMANQYTKEAQLAGKKTKEKAAKPAKAEKAVKADKPAAVKKAADAPKSTAPDGMVALSEIKASHGDKVVHQLWVKARAGTIKAERVGKAWYVAADEVPAKTS